MRMMEETFRVRHNKGRECYEIVGERSDGGDFIVHAFAYNVTDPDHIKRAKKDAQKYFGGFCEACHMIREGELSVAP